MTIGAIRFFLALTLFCGGAQAQKTDLTLGLNFSSFDYKESLEPPLKSTERATVVAPMLQGRLYLLGIPPSFFGFEAEVTGTLKSEFDGSTLSGTPVKDTNYLRFYRIEGAFYVPLQGPFYLYVGLGSKYWDRFLSGGAGYREIYTWGYLPAGILWENDLSTTLRVGLDLSYRMMFNGQIKIIFSETVAGGQDSDLTLGNKPGFKIQVPLRLRIPNSGISLKVTPWYEFSEIGESDVKFNATPSINSGIQEPASRTIQYGLASGLQFSF